MARAVEETPLVDELLQTTQETSRGGGTEQTPRGGLGTKQTPRGALEGGAGSDPARVAEQPAKKMWADAYTCLHACLDTCQDVLTHTLTHV